MLFAGRTGGQGLACTCVSQVTGYEKQIDLLVRSRLPVLFANPSLAATRTWVSGDGFWTFTNNWVEAAEPTSADDVVFDSAVDGGGGRVRLNGGPAGLPFRSARSLTFLDGVGSYLIDGNVGGDKKELQLGSGGILNLSKSLQRLGIRESGPAPRQPRIA